MIGSEDAVIVENETLSEVLFRRLNSRADKNFEFMVDLTKNVSLTFQNILQYSVNLTVSLENLGIKHNDIIGILAENCWEIAIVILAAWNIGASLAFVNPHFIKNELHQSLKITNPKILFTTKNKLQILEDNLGSIEEIILFDEESENQRLGFQSLLKYQSINYENYKPNRFDTKETVACIMSSGGTTGFPKAVMLTHDNINSSIKNLLDPNAMNFNFKSRILIYLPLFHIAGLLLLVGSLNNAEKTLITNKFKAEEFVKTLEEHKVNFLYVVPPVLQFLATSPVVLKYNLSCVENIMCGSAPVSKDFEVEVSNRLKKTKVRQLYGMTETTGLATCIPVNEHRIGSIGKVFKGTRIKIIDPETNEILGPNCNGEICIKGPTIMKGYMGNLKETQNCIDTDGYLHTGDIGYYDDDDFIFVVDRIKDLIKYKAFQVIPAELEAFILKHEEVSDVGVVGKPDVRCGELPTAFVVVKPGGHVTEKDIYNYVADNFSQEKHLRGGVVFVDEIPKTRVGKILRKELRKLLVEL